MFRCYRLLVVASIIGVAYFLFSLNAGCDWYGSSNHARAMWLVMASVAATFLATPFVAWRSWQQARLRAVLPWQLPVAITARALYWLIRAAGDQVVHCIDFSGVPSTLLTGPWH